MLPFFSPCQAHEPAADTDGCTTVGAPVGVLDASGGVAAITAAQRGRTAYDHSRALLVERLHDPARRRGYGLDHGRTCSGCPLSALAIQQRHESAAGEAANL